MLSKRSQTQKTIYCGILSGWCSRTGKSKAAEEQLPREGGRVTGKGDKSTFGEMECSLR